MKQNTKSKEFGLENKAKAKRERSKIKMRKQGTDIGIILEHKRKEIYWI